MKLNDEQLSELAAASERGYLVRLRTSKRLRIAYSHICDAAQAPLIELLAGARLATWVVDYDLVLTGALMTKCEIRAFADLIENLGCHTYTLGPVEGRTGAIPLKDAETVVAATVVILGVAVERCRAERSLR